MAVSPQFIIAAAQTGVGLFNSLFGKSSNSAKQSLSLNKKLMDYQYKLERESRQHHFEDTRFDLENAGYNPMLAVGQQSNYTPVSSGVVPQSGVQESSELATTMAGVSSAMSGIARNKVMNQNDTLNSLGQFALNKSEVNLNNMRADYQAEQNRIQKLTGLTQAMATIKNLESSTSANNSAVKANLASASKAGAEAINQTLENQVKSDEVAYRGRHPYQNALGNFSKATGLNVGDIVKAIGAVGAGVVLKGNPLGGVNSASSALNAIKKNTYSPPAYHNYY